MVDQSSLLSKMLSQLFNNFSKKKNKNKKKSHYGYYCTSGIVLRDYFMEIINTRINELFLFEF